MASSNPRVMPIPDGLVAAGAATAEFEVLAALVDLPPGTLLRVSRGDLDLLLVNGEHGICVIDDRCPHMAAPLSLGTLDGCIIACPLHRGRFNVCDGGVAQFPTTGGLEADGTYHPAWTPETGPGRTEPTDLKARARAATRVRRLRYYPVRINGDWIEARIPR